VLTELGEPGAEAHWQAGFTGHAVVRRRYRGSGPGVPLLLLVSARGGNLATRPWVDDRVFTVTAIYADFHDPAQALPPHALVVNAIGDVDVGRDALACAEAMLAGSSAPVVNPPARVKATGREEQALRLAGIAGVTAPRTVRLKRTALAVTEAFRFPLLLRSPGFHTGQHFVRVDTRDDLSRAAAGLPGDELLAIEWLDARGPDGLARKYRVMIIGGVLYPLHLAISADWKVHYFTAGMAGEAAHRAEDARFLNDMPAVLGQRAMAALSDIGAAMGLDYAGVDFGLAADGSVLLFEANATMAIVPPDQDPMWDYRRAAVAAVQDAARHMLAQRAGCGG
jgi:glutathione synthase/RimK-type ligase-like ATP-grasp enzyme